MFSIFFGINATAAITIDAVSTVTCNVTTIKRVTAAVYPVCTPSDNGTAAVIRGIAAFAGDAGTASSDAGAPLIYSGSSATDTGSDDNAGGAVVNDSRAVAIAAFRCKLFNYWKCWSAESWECTNGSTCKLSLLRE